MIVKFFPLGPAQTNGILLGCSETGKGVIIDVPFEGGELLLKEAEKAGIEIVMILLTHSHWDHIGDLALLKRKSGAPIYVHQLDSENVKAPGADGLPLILRVEGVEPDGFLTEGQVLEVGKLKLKVIHTPGHSPGGVCFYLEEEGLLVSGDTLFQGSIGRLDLPTAQPELMWESLEKLSALPAETRVLPGHGAETTIGAEKWLKNAKEYFGG